MSLILTKEGLAAYAQSEATGVKLQATHMAVGDGGGASVAHTDASETLINETWRGELQRIEVAASGEVEFEGHVPITVGGWYIREVALYADDTLLALGSHPETWKPAPESPDKVELVITAPVMFASADNISLTVDVTKVLATQENVNNAINTHNTSDTAHADIREAIAAVAGSADDFIKSSVIIEKGDIIIGNADGKPERLALPSNGKILGSVDGRPAWVDMPEFISAALGGIPTHSAEFTTDGTWSAPAALLDGVAVVEVQAGGCYGKAAYNYLDAQNSPTPVGAGGGGSGRYFLGLVPVSAGTDYAVTVGVGGDYSPATPAGSSSFADLVSCPAAPASNSADLASIDASVFALFSHAAPGQLGGIGGGVGLGGSAPHGVGGANSSGSGYGAGGSGANDGAPGRVRIWWNQRS